MEIEWLLFLASLPGIKNKFSINKTEKNFIKNIYSKFSTKDALKIKKIEEKINHDVKSIEYYLIEKFNSNKSLKNKAIKFYKRNGFKVLINKTKNNSKHKLLMTKTLL